jgi:hypothetical protein
MMEIGTPGALVRLYKLYCVPPMADNKDTDNGTKIQTKGGGLICFYYSDFGKKETVNNNIKTQVFIISCVYAGIPLSSKERIIRLHKLNIL